MVAAAVVGAVILLATGGFVVHQMGSQKSELVALQRQQAADHAQAAKEKADAAAAKAEAEAASAKAKADATAATAAAKAKADAATLAQVQKDAASAKADARAARAAAARALAIRPYYDGYTPSYTSVWGYFPLTSAIKAAVYVRNSPNTSDGIAGEIFVGDSVGVICSVRGETVSDSLGSTDVWDYVTYPAAGYVSDEFVNEGNQIAPSCY
jgi:hypothetical protein